MSLNPSPFKSAMALSCACTKFLWSLNAASVAVTCDRSMVYLEKLLPLLKYTYASVVGTIPSVLGATNISLRPLLLKLVNFTLGSVPNITLSPGANH